MNINILKINKTPSFESWNIQLQTDKYGVYCMVYNSSEITVDNMTALGIFTSIFLIQCNIYAFIYAFKKISFELLAKTRDPWATSLIWETVPINKQICTNYDFTITLIKREKTVIFDNWMVLICKNLLPLQPGMPNLVEIDPVVLEKKIFKKFFQ